MRAVGTRAALRRIVRFSRDRKACLYYAACVVLLVVAAGLRFHDLPGDFVRYDEAVVANNSGGTLSEVVSNTRSNGSTPILYPLALWAVQKVDISAFSIRVLPATASVLSVAVMLFLLPRLGVARGAVFLAALLATLSVAAIEHARDAREYSIDALLAVLMIAGLLWYLRDGRKALLCLSLFLAALLQYGLVLFGAAVMGAATVLPPPPDLGNARRGFRPSRICHWFQRRIALVWPAGCFLVGCAVSYAVTLRYQLQNEGFDPHSYLSAYYYRGAFDVYSIFEFSITRTGVLAAYHLPWVVAIAATFAFAVLLILVFLKNFKDKVQHSAVMVLFCFCITVSVVAAVLRIYPLGDIRQVIYLGSVIFLAVGVAFHSGSDALASTAQLAWPRGLLIALSAGVIVLAGAHTIRQVDLYWPRDKTEEILTVLQERAQEDIYIIDGHLTNIMEFHSNKVENQFLKVNHLVQLLQNVLIK